MGTRSVVSEAKPSEGLPVVRVHHQFDRPRGRPRRRVVHQPEGLHREGEFWFVPVRLEGFGSTESRFLLYARFAKLESYLQAERGLKVALLPVVEPVAA